jgi:hypothetical protein
MLRSPTTSTIQWLYDFGSNVWILADPRFIDSTNGDFHLQSNSPCINGGNNLYVGSSTDLDGNPRVVGEAIDIGAYEYQSPQSLLPYWWMQRYSLPIDGTADFVDSDNDGMNNWQEFQTGTVPTGSASVLQMRPPIVTRTNVTVIWSSRTSWLNGIQQYYFLQRSTNLLAQPAFSTIQSNIAARIINTNTTLFIDTNAMGPGPYFYRVGVQ